MNEWDQRIREHRVWSEMETLGPIIDSAIAIEDLTPETVAGLDRIRAMWHIAASVLRRLTR